MKQQRKLPIGIQSFSDIRENDYIYVDKTQFLPTLFSVAKQHFLSRPRRFGKSLFVSMLKAYFQGKKELFSSLAIEKAESKLAKSQNRESWINRPVFHLDLSGQIYNKKESLEIVLESLLNSFSENYNLDSTEKDVAVRFREYIVDAYEKTNCKVAILIDEYDKPLLDAIDNQELLDHYKTILKGFYGVLKPMDEYIHFVFITGVTRFDKVSIFSDLNHLCDISTDARFASICGITQNELEKNFKLEIKTMAEKNKLSFSECLATLKQKYDGYFFHSSSEENVYNPFSLVNAFSKSEFGDYWFATGTPTFLLKMIKDMHIDIANYVDGIDVSSRAFENYHIDTSSPEPLLYQAGYLTIKNFNPQGKRYTLAFPNEEVEYGFLELLLPFYLQTRESEKFFDSWKFSEEVRKGDIDAFMKRIQSLFAALPPKKSEKFYELDGQQIFFLIFKLMGEFIQCEVQNGLGRSDAVVWTSDIIYIFEFKLDSSADAALEQIDSKGYAIPFVADGRKIVKVGAQFSSSGCNITEWKVSEG